jgi:perosamine synthetase
MSNVQAAIGCAQLSRWPELTERKRDILAYYRFMLEPTGVISLNPSVEGTVEAAWMPNAVFAVSTGITRDELITVFRAKDIDARVFFWPLSNLPMFAHERKTYPIAADLSVRSINLPSFNDITQSQMDLVIDTLLTLVDRC